MKKVLSAVLCVAMVLSLAACGGKADSKYTGKYTAVVGEMFGMAMTGDDLGGFDIELKEGGKASFTFQGNTESIKWSNTETQIILKVSGEEIPGEIGTDTIKFVDMLGMGMDVTFAKQGTEAAKPENYLPENDKLMIGAWKSYKVTNVLDDDASGEVDPAALEMTFAADHTATVSYLGNDLGTHKWSLLSEFGSFDESDLNITWDIVGQEIKATYSEGDDYFIFYCQK